MDTPVSDAVAPLGHVYVVDDNTDVSYHLSELLCMLGYSVETFASADAFLAHDASIRPAVLLVDMHMPRKSGSQLQQELQQLGRKIPVVFISGGCQASDMEEALRRGAGGFLSKPFSRHALCALLDRGLQIPQA